MSNWLKRAFARVTGRSEPAAANSNVLSIPKQPVKKKSSSSGGGPGIGTRRSTDDGYPLYGTYGGYGTLNDDHHRRSTQSDTVAPYSPSPDYGCSDDRSSNWGDTGSSLTDSGTCDGGSGGGD